MRPNSGRQPAARRFFRQEIRRNRFRLRLALVAFFLLALVAGQVTGKAFLFFADPNEYYMHRYGIGLDGMTEPDSSLFSYVNQVTLAVLLLAWVQYHRMHRRGDGVVLSLVDARPLSEQQLLNTREEMAIAAGIPPPRIWVVESPELNAFTCARADSRATITLTRGLLETLTRGQIQAVVAHETAHIRNGDARLMTLMLGIGRAFHLVSAFALGPLRAIFDAGALDERIRRLAEMEGQATCSG